jgi:hypothetical protein
MGSLHDKYEMNTYRADHVRVSGPFACPQVSTAESLNEHWLPRTRSNVQREVGAATVPSNTFWAIAFLRRFYQIWSGSHFFGFHYYNSYYIPRSSALRPTPPPPLEDQVPVFMSPSDRVAQLNPGHRFPFSSPSTTCRATVEVFYPASIWGVIQDREIMHCNKSLTNTQLLLTFFWV